MGPEEKAFSFFEKKKQKIFALVRGAPKREA
jgi:hypothetical protein